MKKIILAVMLIAATFSAKAWHHLCDKGVLLAAAQNYTPETRQLVQKYVGEDMSKGAYYLAEVELQNLIDTFLDMKDWAKGYVWVNGHLLGRYWNVGPQERLYCPGEFLKQGTNTIEILDLFMTTDTPPAISGKAERNMEVHKETKSLNNQW